MASADCRRWQATDRRRFFKRDPIGFFHIDIAEVRTAQGKLHLLVAIDRTSKFAFAQLHHTANVKAASGLLRAVVEAVPYRIHTVLTDNGIQFGDATQHRSGPTAGYRIICSTGFASNTASSVGSPSPTIPWTSGQVERMNRTL